LGGFLAEQMGFSFPFYLSGGLTAISLLIVSTSGSLKRLNVYSGGETANISLRKTLGGLRNRRLLAISVINFSRMFINYGVVSTVLPLYLYDFLRFNVGFIGVILGVRSLGLCFAIFSSGVMSDKIGRKPVASIGILVSSLCIYSYTMVSSPLALLLIGFFDGWGMGMIQIAIWALLPEQVASEYMGGAIGLFRTFMDAGAVAGPILTLPIQLTFGTNNVFLSGATILSAMILSLLVASEHKT